MSDSESVQKETGLISRLKEKPIIEKLSWLLENVYLQLTMNKKEEFALEDCSFNHYLLNSVSQMINGYTVLINVLNY